MKITVKHTPSALEEYPELGYRWPYWPLEYQDAAGAAGLCIVFTPDPFVDKYLYFAMLNAVDDWTADRQPREAPDAGRGAP